jgi:hypothetical protein
MTREKRMIEQKSSGSGSARRQARCVEEKGHGRGQGGDDSQSEGEGAGSGRTAGSRFSSDADGEDRGARDATQRLLRDTRGRAGRGEVVRSAESRQAGKQRRLNGERGSESDSTESQSEDDARGTTRPVGGSSRIESADGRLGGGGGRGVLESSTPASSALRDLFQVCRLG